MGSLDIPQPSEYRKFESKKERMEAVQQLKRSIMQDGNIQTRLSSLGMRELREYFSGQPYWALLKTITSNDTGESRLRLPQVGDLKKLLEELEGVVVEPIEAEEATHVVELAHEVAAEVVHVVSEGTESRQAEKQLAQNDQSIVSNPEPALRGVDEENKRWRRVFSNQRPSLVGIGETHTSGSNIDTLPADITTYDDLILWLRKPKQADIVQFFRTRRAEIGERAPDDKFNSQLKGPLLMGSPRLAILKFVERTNPGKQFREFIEDIDKLRILPKRPERPKIRPALPKRPSFGGSTSSPPKFPIRTPATLTSVADAIKNAGAMTLSASRPPQPKLPLSSRIPGTLPVVPVRAPQKPLPPIHVSIALSPTPKELLIPTDLSDYDAFLTWARGQTEIVKAMTDFVDGWQATKGKAIKLNSTAVLQRFGDGTQERKVLLAGKSFDGGRDYPQILRDICGIEEVIIAPIPLARQPEELAIPEIPEEAKKSYEDLILWMQNHHPEAIGVLRLKRETFSRQPRCIRDSFILDSIPTTSITYQILLLVRRMKWVKDFTDFIRDLIRGVLSAPSPESLASDVRADVGGVLQTPTPAPSSSVRPASLPSAFPTKKAKVLSSGVDIPDFTDYAEFIGWVKNQTEVMASISGFLKQRVIIDGNGIRSSFAEGTDVRLLLDIGKRLSSKEYHQILRDLFPKEKAAPDSSEDSELEKKGMEYLDMILAIHKNGKWISIAMPIYLAHSSGDHKKAQKLYQELRDLDEYDPKNADAIDAWNELLLLKKKKAEYVLLLGESKPTLFDIIIDVCSFYTVPAAQGEEEKVENGGKGAEPEQAEWVVEAPVIEYRWADRLGVLLSEQTTPMTPKVRQGLYSLDSIDLRARLHAIHLNVPLKRTTWTNQDEARASSTDLCAVLEGLVKKEGHNGGTIELKKLQKKLRDINLP